jgi:RimJ/RimL family protein N-acetyltransferase
VLRGALTVDVEGQRVRVGPREFCCFPAGVFHAVVEVEPPVETLMIRAPSVDDKVYAKSSVSEEAADQTEIRTERLLLRPFRFEDADDLFAIYRDEEVAYFALPGPASRSQTEQRLRNERPWSEAPHFAVVLADRVIGDIVLEINPGDARANLGYAFARDQWGNGYATEATRAVVDYAFRTLGLEKAEARADPRNVRSIRVMERLGMRREGYLRSQVVRRGERCDRVLYGVLLEEWRAPPEYTVSSP